MFNLNRRDVLQTAGIFLTSPVFAQKSESDRQEILLGQTMPYSGPLSVLGVVGKVQLAYFEMLNESGGINGRKVKLLSLDDAYNPAKTVEQTRRLVEQDKVLAMFSVLGSPTNLAIQRYLNQRKVPHLFLLTGSSKFTDPKNSPWSMGSIMGSHFEASIYAAYLAKEKPEGKIAILFQNDDLGRDMLNGFNEVLGARAAKSVVATASYEVSDPSVDSQIVSLRGSGADVLMLFGTSRFCSLALRKSFELGWRPLIFIGAPNSGISSTLAPVGLEKCVGVMTSSDQRPLENPDADAELRAYYEFMKRVPEAVPAQGMEAQGYITCVLMTHVLRQCGNDLTRENLMKQATNIKDLPLPLKIPGFRVNTSPTDYRIVKILQMRRFDGKKYVSVGEPISLGG